MLLAIFWNLPTTRVYSLTKYHLKLYSVQTPFGRCWLCMKQSVEKRKQGPLLPVWKYLLKIYRIHRLPTGGRIGPMGYPQYLAQCKSMVVFSSFSHFRNFDIPFLMIGYFQTLSLDTRIAPPNMFSNTEPLHHPVTVKFSPILIVSMSRSHVILLHKKSCHINGLEIGSNSGSMNASNKSGATDTSFSHQSWIFLVSLNLPRRRKSSKQTHLSRGIERINFLCSCRMYR